MISLRIWQAFTRFNLHFANVGIEDGAIGLNPVTGIAGATILAAGVVSSGDPRRSRSDVARPYAILVIA